jgi:hypothetical protein
VRITVAAALAVIVVGCTQIGPTAAPAANNTASPAPDTAASAPRISPPPVTPPVAPGTNLPGFNCADSSGGTTGVANVTAVRIAEQVDYDRFVLQFDGKVPTYTVKRQAKPTFPMAPSGQSVTLSGTAGALVTVHSATESNTYSGSTDISHTEFIVIKEARLTQDFEGTVSWALGLDHPACMRSFTLTNPARLIVDFTTSTS